MNDQTTTARPTVPIFTRRDEAQFARQARRLGNLLQAKEFLGRDCELIPELAHEREFLIRHLARRFAEHRIFETATWWR